MVIMLCKGGMAMSEEKMGLKKGVFMAVLDTVTFGVPSYLGNLVRHLGKQLSFL